MTDIATLEAAAEFWENWGYVTLAAVLLGVVGESIVEFIPGLIKSGSIRSKFGKASALLLVAGLAGELITQPRTNAANATLVALINKQTAQLQTDLEKERKKNLGRTITKEQFEALQELKGKVAKIYVQADASPDAQLFAAQITNALMNAGIEVKGFFPAPGSSMTGIMVYSKRAFDRVLEFGFRRAYGSLFLIRR
jgi:hypothetical protein